jgi:hypothetical protein
VRPCRRRLWKLRSGGSAQRQVPPCAAAATHAACSRARRSAAGRLAAEAAGSGRAGGAGAQLSAPAAAAAGARAGRAERSGPRPRSPGPGAPGPGGRRPEPRARGPAARPPHRAPRQPASERGAVRAPSPPPDAAAALQALQQLPGVLRRAPREAALLREACLPLLEGALARGLHAKDEAVRQGIIPYPLRAGAPASHEGVEAACLSSPGARLCAAGRALRLPNAPWRMAAVCTCAGRRALFCERRAFMGSHRL